MTDDTGGAHAEPDPTEPDQIRADIAQTRAELSDTVDQLSAKLDVKAQASDKVAEVKARTKQFANRALDSAPPQVQQALNTAGQKLGPTARQMSDKTRPHRGKIIVGVAVVLLVVVVRRRRSRGVS